MEWFKSKRIFPHFQPQGEGGSKQSQKKGLPVTELREERRREEEEEEAEEGAAAAAEAPPLQVLLLGGGRRQEEPIQEVISLLITLTTDLAATRYGTCISFA